MFCSNSCLDDVISSLLLADCKIKDRKSRGENEIDIVAEAGDDVKMLKIFDVSQMKEKRMLKLLENQLFLSECYLPFIYTSRMYEMSNMMMLYERPYYECDLKEIIYSKCLSINDISSIMIKLNELLIDISDYGVNVSNLKSSNIIYENSNNQLMLCDLCLNVMRIPEEMRIDEICYSSPEELNGNEINEKSIIWSIGCILYEMLNKRLPFNEDDDVNKTMNNILKCKLSDDINVDDEMKEILFGILKVICEDRLSLSEFNKEMNKENEMMKDSENYLTIVKERKEMLFNNDYLIEISPFEVQSEYYLNYNKWEELQDYLIEKYNNKADERVLSILLMMKLYKKDYSIKDKLRFQIHHQCEELNKCRVDEMMINIGNDWNDKEIVEVKSDCICYCEEGLNYMFRILKLINPTKLRFCIILIFLYLFR